MMARFKTLNNWNEDKVPMTKTKKTKLIEALPSLYKYIKEEFILKERNLSQQTNSSFLSSNDQRVGQCSHLGDCREQVMRIFLILLTHCLCCLRKVHLHDAVPAAWLYSFARTLQRGKLCVDKAIREKS